MRIYQFVLFLLAATGQLWASPQAELMVQIGQETVNSVSFSPNGQQVLTGGDNVALLWDAAGQEIRAFVGHAGGVNAAVFSPSGKLVLTASNDRTARLWSASTGNEIQRFECERAVTSVTFSPDSRQILTGSSDGTVRLWDTTSGKEILQVKAAGSSAAVLPTAVAFSPNGKEILAGTRNIAQLWDASTGRELRRFEGHTYPINAVAFSPDGRFVLTGSNDHTARLWETATAREIHRFEEGQTRPGASGGILSVAFSPDGRKVFTGSEDNTARLWDVASGQVVLLLRASDAKLRLDNQGLTSGVDITGGHHSAVTSVAFSPDGRHLLTAERDRAARLWDVASGKQLLAFEGSVSAVPYVSSVTFSPDSLQLWTTGPRVWDLKRGILARQPTKRGASYTAALSPDGLKSVLSVLNQLYLYDNATGTALLQFDNDSLEGSIDTILFSPSGRQVLTASGQFKHDGVVRLWDTSTGKEVLRFTTHEQEVRKLGLMAEEISSVAFSPDGRQVLSAGGDKIARLWDTATGKQIMTFEVRYVPKKVGTTDDEFVNFNTRIDIFAVAFSPDGEKLVTGSFDVRVWDKATGKEILRLEGQPGLIEAVAFSPDGRHILAASQGTLRVWDAVSGRETFRSPDQPVDINAIAFSPNGRFVASSGRDGTVRLWSFANDRLQLIATLVSFSAGGWVVSDPEGRFDTNNQDEITGLSWVFPDEPFRALPPEIFMRDYYEPRLLPRLLAGEELPKVRPLGDLNRVQPGVRIVGVKPGSQPDLADVTVEVSPAEGQFQREGKPVTRKTDVYDLRLFRVGQLVGQEPELSPEAEASLRNGVVLSPEALKAWQVARKVKLVAGRVELDAKTGKLTRTFTVRLPHAEKGKEIEFTAYAFNEDRVKSETAKASYTVPVDAGPVKRRAYLVSIGVNAYENPGWDLRFAASDAETLQRALAKRLPSQYEVVPVTLISDCKIPGCPKDGKREIGKDDAKKASLHAVLELLAGHPLSEELKKSVPPEEAAKIRKAEPDDLVAISVSSHGYTSKEGMFYLIPSDSGQTEGHGLTPELRQKWISSDELSAWLRDVDAGEMVMVVDTCHSAATVEEPGFKPGPMGSRGLGQLAYDKGMRILAASQANDVALESEQLMQGLLTYALVHDGLEARQAVKPGTQEITLDSWLKYGSDRVPKLYEEVLHNNVQTFADAPRDVTIYEQLSGGTSTLKKPNAFQQPSLFNFRKTESVVILSR